MIPSLRFFILMTCLVASAHADETPLTKSMELLNTSFKELRVALRTPEPARKPEYLALVAAIRAEAVTSKTLTPSMLVDLPAAEKETELAAYQKSMEEFIVAVDELAKLIADEQWDAANSAIKGLNTRKTEGHERFQKPE